MPPVQVLQYPAACIFQAASTAGTQGLGPAGRSERAKNRRMENQYSLL